MGEAGSRGNSLGLHGCIDIITRQLYITYYMDAA